jgi:4a-hydroxytetrahydrobiopterin dehydratase
MWKQLEDALVAELEFKNFVDAFAFMADVAALAEEHAHHPEWSNVYNRVTIRLTTHDAGNQVTDKDRKLAKAIEALASASLVQLSG